MTLAGLGESPDVPHAGLEHHSPVTHGFTKLLLEISDGVVVQAKPQLGSMHRGAEKLFESRDYRQVLMLANRHEWLCAFSGEVGVAQLLERALRIEVPNYATLLRTLLLEMNRLTAHLAFLAGFPWQQSTVTNQLRDLRESWVRQLQQYTGSRMHPMITRIGGVTHAPSHAWLTKVHALSQTALQVVATTEKIAEQELHKYISLGVIDHEQAISHALTGPVARASGYAIDLRNSDQHEHNANGLQYQNLNSWKIVTHTSGDVESRLRQLFNEINTSIQMIEELTTLCSDQYTTEVNVLLPKVLRIPEGAYEHSIETPLGIASWFLVSRGDKTPYKLKLRPASLPTVLALPSALAGAQFENIGAIVASMPFIAGDVDR